MEVVLDARLPRTEEISDHSSSLSCYTASIPSCDCVVRIYVQKSQLTYPNPVDYVSYACGLAPRPKNSPNLLELTSKRGENIHLPNEKLVRCQNC